MALVTPLKSSQSLLRYLKLFSDTNGRYLSTISGALCQKAHLVDITLNNNGYQELQRATKTTNRFEIMDPSDIPIVPAYRVLNPDGSLVDQTHSNLSLTSNKMVELYKDMVKLNTFDKIMFDCHRQGRISFYMTSFGEEATTIGSAAALEPEDWIYAQYREAGVLIHRQMSLKQMLAQCFGNNEDLGKGRQMPIHYGNRELNFVTLSSPLTTQLPQAVGSAYAFKNGVNLTEKSRLVMCFFGEGAASEGDAHAAMNMAATLSCPIIFFCRNNGYAISTPNAEQFVGDGIVQRALGYGMSSIRVDGNDLFAIYEATLKAREFCLTESRPILIEAMTYRVGHHSTSDDSSAYRSVEEVERWEREDSPIKRVHKYLLNLELWSQDKQTELEKETRGQVLEALNWAERKKKLPISSMFDDVYDHLPKNLQRQREELLEHLDTYGQHYSIDEYEKSI